MVKFSVMKKISVLNRTFKTFQNVYQTIFKVSYELRELFGLAPLPPTPPPEQMTAEEAREVAREVNKKMVMKIAGTVVTVAGGVVGIALGIKFGLL